MFVWIHLWLLGLLLSSSFAAPAPEVSTNDLPRFSAVEATNALGTFQVKPGFRLELVASEPLVRDPVAVSFDENGRMFVVEMGDYSERRDEKLGRIRLLEDTDHDGRFDKATTYAEGLAWPTAVICSQGGIFVCATPDLLWLKDTNGDGRADERKVVFTGFGAGMSRLNVQALPNSLQWGLDGRIYGATGPNGGTITSATGAFTNTVDLRGRDFAFDPRTLRLEAVAGGGQHGMSFDNGGRRYATSNSRHLMAFVFDERYLKRNPFLQPTPSLIDIPTDGPAAEVFRLSPEEPWRVIRTHWRVAGQVEGPVEGGGRASGYFTGATGGTIYRGNAFPAEFVGDAFIGDAGGNLVHHKRVNAAGIEPVAQRPGDEVGMEFVASRDTWFRPVQFANAPDGSLVILDMYREIIEHPWSIPETLKKHLDLNSGNDRGRIYRLVPDRFKQPKPLQLGTANTEDLVRTLAHPNGWHRDTAQRLLLERSDRSAGPALERVLNDPEKPLGRLHALHTLEGLGLLNDRQLVRSLNDPDADVRRHSVQLAETRIASIEVRAAITARTEDSDPRVRFQLAFTLGELPEAEAVPALARLATRDGANRWIRFAIQTGSPRRQRLLFDRLAESTADFSGRDTLLPALLRTIGAASGTNDITALVPVMRRLGSLTLWQALESGLAVRGTSLQRVLDGRTSEAVTAEAVKAVRDQGQRDPQRLAALALLGRFPGDAPEVALSEIIHRDAPAPIRIEAIRQLLNRRSETGISNVLTLLPSMPAAVRSGAITELIGRPETARRVLAAVEAGTVAPEFIGRLQRQSLAKSRDATVVALAAKVLGNGSASNRSEILTRFQPAVSLPGTVEAGRKLYHDRCSACHRADGVGSAVGPDLVTVRNAGREKLLVAIIDPNREVAPQFSRWTAEVSDGETHSGIVVSETPTMVTLRQGGGQETTLQRANLTAVRNEDASLMPEDLQAGLTPSDMADLLRFIESVRR